MCSLAQNHKSKNLRFCFHFSPPDFWYDHSSLVLHPWKWGSHSSQRGLSSFWWWLHLITVCIAVAQCVPNWTAKPFYQPACLWRQSLCDSFLFSLLLLVLLVCGPTSTKFDRAEVALSSYSFHETRQKQKALGAPSWRAHQHPPKRDFRDSSRREKPLIRLKPCQMLENAATRPASVGNQSSPVLPRTPCLGFLNAPK